MALPESLRKIVRMTCVSSVAISTMSSISYYNTGTNSFLRKLIVSMNRSESSLF